MRLLSGLCMPALDPDVFMEALVKLVLLEKTGYPMAGYICYNQTNHDCYRGSAGVHPSDEYLFFHYRRPVGAYYPEGFNPTKIYVSEEYVRSVRGGTGTCKNAGNYAASLYASQIAMKMGYTQVLWLDAIERKYVEEVGTSNIFFLIGDELVTAPLEGTIRPE
jgi:branched-chain amino acid aminotransferase